MSIMKKTDTITLTTFSNVSAKNEVLQILQVLYRHDVCHIYGLLNNHEFKMARYCPNSFFSIFMDQ